MAYGDYIYYWRHKQPEFVGRTQLARYLGVGAKMVESIEQNVRSPGPAVRDRLEQLIALGKQRADVTKSCGSRTPTAAPASSPGAAWLTAPAAGCSRSACRTW
jgi:hypothetical protein